MNKTVNAIDEVYRNLNIGNIGDKREIETFVSQPKQDEIDTPVDTDFDTETSDGMVWFLATLLLLLSFLLGLMIGMKL